MIEGAAADRGQTGIAEAAAMLHDRDIVSLTFTGSVPAETIQAFLRVLTLDPAERRRRGGPAPIWADEGDSSLANRTDRLRQGAGPGGGRGRRARQARRPLALDRAVHRRRPADGLRRPSAGAAAGHLHERPRHRRSRRRGGRAQVHGRRLADGHVAGRRSARRLPPPDRHRLGDVARTHAGSDGPSGNRGDPARSPRDHAGDAERRRFEHPAGGRRAGGGVRRRQSRAAAGDGAGASTATRRIASRRSSTRSPPTTTASGAC